MRKILVGVLFAWVALAQSGGNVPGKLTYVTVAPTIGASCPTSGAWQYVPATQNTYQCTGSGAIGTWQVSVPPIPTIQSGPDPLDSKAFLLGSLNGQIVAAGQTKGVYYGTFWPSSVANTGAVLVTSVDGKTLNIAYNQPVFLANPFYGESDLMPYNGTFHMVYGSTVGGIGYATSQTSLNYGSWTTQSPITITGLPTGYNSPGAPRIDTTDGSFNIYFHWCTSASFTSCKPYYFTATAFDKTGYATTFTTPVQITGTALTAQYNAGYGLFDCDKQQVGASMWYLTCTQYSTYSSLVFSSTTNEWSGYNTLVSTKTQPTNTDGNSTLCDGTLDTTTSPQWTCSQWKRFVDDEGDSGLGLAYQTSTDQGVTWSSLTLNTYTKYFYGVTQPITLGHGVMHYTTDPIMLQALANVSFTSPLPAGTFYCNSFGYGEPYVDPADPTNYVCESGPQRILYNLGTPNTPVNAVTLDTNSHRQSTPVTGTGYMLLNSGITQPVSINGSSLTVASGPFILSGNQSIPAWTTNGARIQGVSGTLTDTTSSGTVAAAYTDVLGGNTIAASSAATYTNYYAAYFKNPVAGTNVTMTNKFALGADSINSVGPVTASQFIASGSASTGFSVLPSSNSGIEIYVGAGLLLGTSTGVGFSVNTPNNCCDANLSNPSTGIISFDTGTLKNSLGSAKAAAFLPGGTKFTVTASGTNCSTPTGTLGGSFSGSFVTAGIGTSCTYVITLNGAAGYTAPNGWGGYGVDTGSGLSLTQSGVSTTTLTLVGTVVSGDTISFYAWPY